MVKTRPAPSETRKESAVTRNEIIEFVKRNPVFALATCAGDVPSVRNMMVAFADDRGIIFSTGRDKDVCRQILANPRVEACFYSAREQKQLRIVAVAGEIDDLELRKEIVEKFDFLKSWIDEVGYEALAVFRLTEARAATWTMETDREPTEYVPLADL